MGKKYRFIKSMPFVEAFGSLDPELYLFSMHTLVATQHLHSMVRVRSVLGSLGRPTMISQRYLSVLPGIPSNSWVSTLRNLRN